MRILFTDGEMTNLAPDFGQLLCASGAEYNPRPRHAPTSWKPWKDVQLLTLRDYREKRWDDKSLALEWRDLLEQYDIIVTWNGIKFDFPFLNARLKRWGLREIQVKHHKDLLYTARYGLHLSSSRLANVASFLKIDQKYGTAKTEMEPERWVMAAGGHRASMRYIEVHNMADVKVLAAVWEEMKSQIREIK